MSDEPTRPLTARQEEVAALLAAGLTRGEVAATLGISLGAVKRHIEGIALRLECNGRALRATIVRYVVRREAA